MNSNPLVTVALFSYNQENYIYEAVNSILSQEYKPLQIILSDDCSQDKTFSIIEETIDQYRSKDEIILNRNSRNLGIGGHINKIMEMARGELIVLAGGDDISLPYRVTDTVSKWSRSNQEGLSFCSKAVKIDQNGNMYGELPPIKPVTLGTVMDRGARWIYGASHTFHRSLFEKFGPLRDDVISEDKAIGFRSLLLGQEIVFIKKPLIKYRVHPSNITEGFSSKEKLKQKIITLESYLEDIVAAKSKGYLNAGKETDEVYRKLNDLRENFTFRDNVLNAGVLNAVVMILTSGKTISFQQKKRLLIKKIFHR